MKNEFTLENTKDATHYAISKVGKINFYKLCGGISFMMGSTTNFEWEEFGPALKLTSLTDETGRGYPTLEWFLDAEHLLEEGDVVITESGKSITVSEENDHNGINGWNTGVTDDNKRWVKSTHDNRHDLTQMARDEYYSKIGKPVKLSEHPLKKEVIDKINSGEITFSAPTGEKQWPNNDRIDAIGQNGNNGEHYPNESESPLSPNFKSKPVYTQEMADNGELPPVGSKCFCTFKSDDWEGKTVKVYSHDVSSNDNAVLAGAEISSGGVIAVEFHTKYLKPIDTRTDEEKLRDALVDQLASKGDMHNEFGKARDAVKWLMESNKFTITLNEEG